MGTINSSDRVAVTLYSLGNMASLGNIYINTPHKGIVSLPIIIIIRDCTYLFYITDSVNVNVSVKGVKGWGVEL
jgi:hypothetical protein